MNTHCFDALMKDRFMNKIKLAKFSNEFDVPQHLDLGNGSLFLLLREEGTIMLIIDWKTKKPVLHGCGKKKTNRFCIEVVLKLTINISGSVFKFILKFRY